MKFQKHYKLDDVNPVSVLLKLNANFRVLYEKKLFICSRIKLFHLDASNFSDLDSSKVKSQPVMDAGKLMETLESPLFENLLHVRLSST